MVIVDTGFWLALGNVRDKHHARAVKVLAGIREPLVTTWPVLTETCHLLLQRRGERAQRRFLAGYAQGAFHIHEIGDEQIPRILQLLDKYADLPTDLADASRVVLAEALSHGRILSTDQRDFHAYRWKQREPFDNLFQNGP
jgi:uncharacterized protein